MPLKPLRRALLDAIDQPPHRLKLGLHAVATSRWFELYEDDDLQLRRKWHLLDTHEDVLATCTGSESAQAELLGSMVEHLCHHHPDRYRRCSVRGRPHLRLPSLRCLLAVDGRDEPPIATAARLVSDDLCLMRADGEHAHTLVAAAVCFPTRWSLRAKMGSSMAAIHAPVPGYQARIGTASDRLMSAVGTQRPLERENWSVLDDAAL
ncbi:MAG: DUF3445 domain-containing protein, partial [Gammaproteobacteria bacterium]|nr:DUF3445 domain-containing protein [Gammaproteobacteria bacterium]